MHRAIRLTYLITNRFSCGSLLDLCLSVKCLRCGDLNPTCTQAMCSSVMHSARVGVVTFTTTTQLIYLAPTQMMRMMVAKMVMVAAIDVGGLPASHVTVAISVNLHGPVAKVAGLRCIQNDPSLSANAQPLLPLTLLLDFSISLRCGVILHATLKWKGSPLYALLWLETLMTSSKVYQPWLGPPTHN